MNQLSLVVAGFCIVSSMLLLIAYAVFIRVPVKSAFSILSCAALVAALCAIEIGHWIYFQGGPRPFETTYYRVAMFTVPSAFYFFGRWAILPTEPFRPQLLIHLAPILLLLVPLLYALPILFTFGAAYALWLAYLVYGLRERRKQFRFEFLYFAVMSLLGVIVLALGFALPYVGDDVFYRVYNIAVGLGIAIMIVALVANPQLIGDLSEAARVKYGTSTLGGVDIRAALEKLARVMSQGKAYQNEDLSLNSLAAEVGLSAHQLSELINSRLGMGFSRYVRERRVEAAKALLLAVPSQSILSVSLDTGFRSQSAFYAAFKELTGQSPGDFRESHLRNDVSGRQ
ncbi:MAG TPA: helix-turn-helix domain-containing protein [Steroidobacteraceae bacterium]|nr:helix-turn-helix domain-containing protein [Steroidobacteraceae bacterium]